MGHAGRARAGLGVLLAFVASVVTSLLGVVPAAHATEGGCDADRDVRVVVEFHRLPHEDLHACVPAGGSGEDAAALLDHAGLELTDVQRQPGFVCRVDGLPADDPCVNTPPADAYWALWWSDGTSPDWVYSTVMASSLEVPTGGAVALVWNQGSADVRPAAPAVPTVPSASGPAVSATQDRSQDASPDSTGDAAGSADGGLPGWVAPVGIAVLLAAAGAVAVVRRRSGAPRA